MIFFFLEFGALSLLCFTNERRTNFKKKSYVLTVLLNVQSHVVKVQIFFFFFFFKKRVITFFPVNYQHSSICFYELTLSPPDRIELSFTY
jgi:hypothetical protein